MALQNKILKADVVQIIEKLIWLDVADAISEELERNKKNNCRQQKMKMVIL